MARDQGSIVFLGTATVMLRYGGFTILVDPRFLHHGDHVHVAHAPAASCVTESAGGREQLTSIDFALLSNPREQRSASPGEQELDRHVPILTTPRAAKTLRPMGFTAARGLATWETFEADRADVAVRVTAVPARQGCVADDAFLPDSMEARLEFVSHGAGLRLHVSGDLPVDEHLRELLRRDPALDLALLKVGSTRVLGFASTGDSETDTALRLVGLHPASSDGGGSEAESSLEELAQALRCHGVEAQVHVVAPGEPYVFRPSRLPALPAVGCEGARRGASAGGDRPAAG